MISGVLILLTAFVFGQENSNSNSVKELDLSMYPAPKEGVSMFTIQLEPKENETAYQIELFAGKNAEVDCNTYRLMGEFSTQTVQGWGYSYYEFNSNGQIMGTRRACADNLKQNEFVKSSGNLVRYNSKLPVVVYIPNEMSLRYKIWESNNLEFEAKQQ